MKRIALLIGIAGLAFCARATAQGFNIDIGATYGTPSSGFGAGAAQPGVWNNVLGVQGTTPLASLTGASTGVTIACVGAGSYDFSFNNAGTSGDDEALMDDGSDPTSAGPSWTISGLAPGNYVLYTYAWAPDNAAYFSLVDEIGRASCRERV